MGAPSMRCHDCGKNIIGNFDEYFMVTNELWKKYGVGKKLLCVGCFEKRLGRKLQASDLTDCPVNTQWNSYTKKILNIE